MMIYLISVNASIIVYGIHTQKSIRQKGPREPLKGNVGQIEISRPSKKKNFREHLDNNKKVAGEEQKELLVGD
jgi:hypothetical protein